MKISACCILFLKNNANFHALKEMCAIEFDFKVFIYFFFCAFIYLPFHDDRSKHKDCLLM